MKYKIWNKASSTTTGVLRGHPLSRCFLFFGVVGGVFFLLSKKRKKIPLHKAISNRQFITNATNALCKEKKNLNIIKSFKKRFSFASKTIFFLNIFNCFFMLRFVFIRNCYKCLQRIKCGFR